MKFCQNEQSDYLQDCSFCLLGHLPNPLGTLDFSNGCAFLQNAFVHERVEDGSSFSSSVSFSMPRMRSTFAFTTNSSFISSLVLRYSA